MTITTHHHRHHHHHHVKRREGPMSNEGTATTELTYLLTFFLTNLLTCLLTETNKEKVINNQRERERGNEREVGTKVTLQASASVPTVANRPWCVPAALALWRRSASLCRY
eukprot:GHVU01097265.1.p1 GENE.GHVU01097265.1~~GHVU01097265.1.p1  ORF type:complete len:111 (-),score=6.01 GHVU01097265.1:221-553(-)